MFIVISTYKLLAI